MVTENRSETYRIPTREEHQKTVRKIWRSCILIGLSVMASMAGMVGVMVLKDFSHQLIVSFTTIFFQVVIAGVFTGFTTPYFLETRVNFSVGMEMNRKALELGTQTAENLSKLEHNFEPLIERSSLLLTKAEKLISGANGDGAEKFDRLLAALEKVAVRVSQNADEQLGSLLEEAWAPEEEKPPAVDTQGKVE
jgi:hypothetical protein